MNLSVFPGKNLEVKGCSIPKKLPNKNCWNSPSQPFRFTTCPPNRCIAVSKCAYVFSGWGPSNNDFTRVGKQRSLVVHLPLPTFTIRLAATSPNVGVNGSVGTIRSRMSSLFPFASIISRVDKSGCFLLFSSSETNTRQQRPFPVRGEQQAKTKTVGDVVQLASPLESSNEHPVLIVSLSCLSKSLEIGLPIRPRQPMSCFFRVFEYLETANFFSPCTVWSRDFFTVGLVEPMSDHNGGKKKTSLKPLVLLKIQK